MRIRLFASMIVASLLGIALPSASLVAGPRAPASTSDEGQIIDLPLAGGGHQRILYDAPSQPRATLVMLPGGAGDVGLARDGEIKHGENFVIRTRADWIAKGYAVLIPDTIDRANLRGARSSAGYAALVVDLAQYAHRRTRAPVFLIGTSQGSIAAVNAAAHASRDVLNGVVLTESVSVMGHSGETVFDADPQDVHVPVLIVANRDDRCDVAPPTMAARIAAALQGSSDVRVLTVSGGISRSDNDCGSLSPHGYYGIEQRVIASISGWLGSHGG